MVSCHLLPSPAQFLILPHSISTHSRMGFAYPPALSPYTTSFSTFQPLKKRKPLGLYFDVCHPPSCTLKFNHCSSEFDPVIVVLGDFFCPTLAFLSSVFFPYCSLTTHIKLPLMPSSWPKSKIIPSCLHSSAPQEPFCFWNVVSSFWSSFSFSLTSAYIAGKSSTFLVKVNVDFCF